MISCPNCQHQNPDGATQCEACYTPLPTTSSCPNCGAPIQSNATFCGQCGFNLLPEENSVGQEEASTPSSIPPTVTAGTNPSIPSSSPDLEEENSISSPPSAPPVTISVPPTNPPITSSAPEVEAEVEAEVEVEVQQQTPPPSTPPINNDEDDPDPITLAEINKPPLGMGSSTQLQIQKASLFHVQTGTKIELQQNLSVIHIGKPNEQIPPDVDVSGFPNSEIVSRIHCDIRVEGDSFFIEDVGSSNGTYVNHTPLLEGNRHRLRPGDRIALGKGDKMTFTFQMS